MDFTAQPGPPIAYATPEVSVRPTSVFVITIIGIVYASLGLLSGLLGLVSFAFFAVYMRRQAGPFGAGFQLGWNLTFAFGGLLLAGLLLFASISAIRMREAGRVWVIRWAWAYIAWQVFTLAVQALVIMPAALAAATSNTGGPGGTGTVAMPPSARLIMYVAPLVSLVVTVVFPVFVLAFMNRAHVRAAYDRAVERGLTGGRVTFAGEPQPAPYGQQSAQ
jgi:hypothetical protein